MAKKSRSFVRLYDENNHYIKYVEHDLAAKRIREGQWEAKTRNSGRLIEVKVSPPPPRPSNSPNSMAMITEGECRRNAFAHLKLKFGEDLNEADELVLEKMAGFEPTSVAYLGPSWGDCLRLVPAQL